MLKGFVTAAVAVALCAAAVLGQTRRRRQPAAQAEAAIINILQVDFKNYTFPLGGRAYKLIDGFYAEAAGPPGAQWGLMMADGPYYGDLTGDKKEEAVIVFRHGPVGAFDTAEARVYTLRGGRAELLATLALASGVDCELDHYIDLDDGMLRVERVFGNGTRCDHHEVTQYRWDGQGFMPVGEVKTRPCRCM
jgi:hypothetical protein